MAVSVLHVTQILCGNDFLNKQILYNCVSHFVTPELLSRDIQGTGVHSLLSVCKVHMFHLPIMK